MKRLVNITLTSLKNFRSKFDDIYNKCIELAKEEGLESPQLPRQTKRPNRYVNSLPSVPRFETVELKYNSIFLGIINSTIDEINNRFSDETLKPLLSIAHILQQDDIEKNREHIQVVRDLNFYNHLVDFERLEIELDSWKVFRTLCKINDQDDISEIAKIFYQEKAYKDYPQLYALFKIYLAIPVTSVVSERSFSTLKRIKSYLRNSIGQERLSSLAILSIEKELTISIDIDQIIDKFASKNRRLAFF